MVAESQESCCCSDEDELVSKIEIRCSVPNKQEHKDVIEPHRDWTMTEKLQKMSLPINTVRASHTRQILVDGIFKRQKGGSVSRDDHESPHLFSPTFGIPTNFLSSH